MAEAGSPIEPVSTDAASLSRSPNRLPATITSKAVGRAMSCISALSA
jgi:hypothetical protein